MVRSNITKRTNQKKKRLSIEIKEKIYAEFTKLINKGNSNEAAYKTLSDKFKVSKATIKTQQYKMRNKGCLSHGNQTLSSDEERQILGIIHAFAAINKPISKSHVIQLVKSLFPERLKSNGNKWYERFMITWKRHIRARKVKGLGHKRQNQNLLNDCKNWVKFFPDWIAENEIAGDCIVNADETRLRLDGQFCTQKRLVKANSYKPSIVEGKRNKCSTYLPFVCSDGTRILDVFILPMEGDKCDATIVAEKRNLRLNVPMIYLFSDNGWLKSEHWMPILEVFCEIVALKRPGRRICLLLDNLQLHHDLEAAIYCSQFNVLLCFMPPNASHFLQPCDDKIFGVYKSKIMKEFNRNSIFETNGKTKIGDYLLLLGQIAVDYINSAVILSSFKAVGISPWNPNLIVKNAKQNCPISRGDDVEKNAVVKNVANAVTNLLKKSEGFESSTRVRARVNPAVVYSTDDLLRLHVEKCNLAREKAAEKSRAEKAKAESKSKRESAKAFKMRLHCKSPLHSQGQIPKWKGETSWLWCEHCDSFGLCESCLCDGIQLLETHEAECSTSLGNHLGKIDLTSK